MPRKRREKKDQPADQVATQRALADALGVSEQAMSAYAAAGCVIGSKGAWSISGTYRAAVAAGFQPRPPRDPAVARLCGIGSDSPPPPRASRLPGESAYDELIADGEIDYKTAKAREELIGEQLTNVKRKVEADLAQAKVMEISEARKAAALVRDRFVALGVRLPALVVARLGDLPPAQQQIAMIAVEKAWADGLAEVSE